MKKQLFVLSILAGMTLAGCSLFGPKTDGYEIVPEFSGGKKGEKQAILEAINNLSPVVNKAGGDLFPDTPSQSLKEDSGDYVKVTTSQVYDKYTVKLEWEADTTQASYMSRDKADDEHDVFSLNFPGYGGSDGTFSWTLKKATCGSAETAGDKVASYSAKLKGYTHKHEATSIAQINAVTEGEYENPTTHVKNPSRFDMVDYANTEGTAYFKHNTGETEGYYYVSTKGKIIYYSPDGNWMLLGDGNQVVEVYAGSALDLTPAGYPAIKTGAYVQVDGNLSQYNGNIQIGFVTKIIPCEQGAIADPVDNMTITESFIANTLKLPSPYKCEKQAIDGFSNSICTVTGTVKTAKTTGVKSGARFTFVLKVGEQELTVAYDYHTDKEGTLGLFDALKTKIATAGTSMTIRGTMRYAGSDSDPFNQANIQTAVWNLTPFLAADVH